MRMAGAFVHSIAILLAASFAASANAERLEGRIVAITDGDTVTLLDSDKRQYKIRLNGIDTPEMGQPFGRAARQHLSDLVANQKVVADCVKTDRYGREVCQIWVDAVDAGLEQLRSGLAWYFERYAHDLKPSSRQTYSSAETQAKSARMGLWSDAQPTAPWDWRVDKR